MRGCIHSNAQLHAAGLVSESREAATMPSSPSAMSWPVMDWPTRRRTRVGSLPQCSLERQPPSTASSRPASIQIRKWTDGRNGQAEEPEVRSRSIRLDGFGAGGHSRACRRPDETADRSEYPARLRFRNHRSQRERTDCGRRGRGRDGGRGRGPRSEHPPAPFPFGGTRNRDGNLSRHGDGPLHPHQNINLSQDTAGRPSRTSESTFLSR